MELDNNKEIFSKNLKRIMFTKNLSQADVIKSMKLSQSTFSDWYTGKKIPRMNMVTSLAEFFNVPLSSLLEENNEQTTQSNRIPVFRRIPAGIPIELIEDVVDYEELSSSYFVGDKEYFGVKVDGNSMYPKYLSGDVLIVQKQNDCESGQDCIVMVNSNDGTFKRVLKKSNGIALQPLNPDYEPIFYNNNEVESLPVKILGVVIEIRRKV